MKETSNPMRTCPGTQGGHDGGGGEGCGEGGGREGGGGGGGGGEGGGGKGGGGGGAKGGGARGGGGGGAGTCFAHVTPPIQLPLPTHMDMRGHVLDGWLYA